MPGLLSRSISALRAAVWLGFQAALPCAFNAAFIAAVASDGRNKTKINEILRCAGRQCALVPWRLGSFAISRLPAGLFENGMGSTGCTTCGAFPRPPTLPDAEEVAF